MQKSIIVALIAAAVTPFKASAAPTFLICTLTDKEGDSRFDVQVNEEAGTVSYFTQRTQRSVSFKAIFTPQQVSFGPFRIDRRDLSFQRVNDGEYDQSIFKMAPVDSGRCQPSNEKRAF